MMKAAALELDERRELWRLLNRLTPRQRIRFLNWACRQVRNRGNLRVTTHSGTANEAYADLVHLEHQFGLDLNTAACRLERLVRKGR